METYQEKTSLRDGIIKKENKYVRKEKDVFHLSR